MPHVAGRAPAGWRRTRDGESDSEALGYAPFSEEIEEVQPGARKRAWARLIAKVCEIDPLICPESGSETRFIAVIEDPEEIRHVMQHLIKIGRGRPG